jgi:hypothetical protein
MEKETIKILGIRAFSYLPKAYSSPDYEPQLKNLKGIHRKYWTLQKKINTALISCFFVLLIIIIACIIPFLFAKKSKICDSVLCINNGKCLNSNGTCLCLTQEFFGDSCQYCNYN